MVRAASEAGICGFPTFVEARATDDPRRVTLDLQSGCGAMQKLAEARTDAGPLRESTFRRALPRTRELAAQHGDHAACPVPAGIIKVVEIAAGLALPADVT